MDNAVYASLTRQAGLLREMQSVANNIANLSTTGFRRQDMMFAEHVQALESQGGSLSMATADIHHVATDQGALTQTNGRFDLAIEGEGYFLIQTSAGNQLTRAGNFVRSGNGELVTQDGQRLLDAGGAPIFVPPDAGSVSVASDGTLSADGNPLARIGLYRAVDPTELHRQSGSRFSVESGVDPVIGADANILQGYLEESNVDPVMEIARMTEIQNAYELGQSFLQKEDDRIGSVISTLGR